MHLTVTKQPPLLQKGEAVCNVTSDHGAAEKKDSVTTNTTIREQTLYYRHTAHQSNSTMSTPKDDGLQELEETVSRLSAHKGVEAVLMLNRDGNILVSSASTEEASVPKQAKFMKQLVEVSAKLIACLDPEDSISFVQVRSKQHEVMLAPHNDYILAVLQDPLVAQPSAI